MNQATRRKREILRFRAFLNRSRRDWLTCPCRGMDANHWGTEKWFVENGMWGYR
jgi:hypothetical protein